MGENFRLRLWQHAIFFLVFFLVAAPLSFLILGSFSTARLPTDFSLSTMGVVNYIKVYSDPGTIELFVNTVIYVPGSTPPGFVLAVAVAWLVQRTNMPCMTCVYAGVAMGVAVPGIPEGVAWVLLSSPRVH